MSFNQEIYNTLSVGELAFLMSTSEDNILKRIETGEIDFADEATGETRFDKEKTLKFLQEKNSDSSILGW